MFLASILDWPLTLSYQFVVELEVVPQPDVGRVHHLFAVLQEAVAQVADRLVIDHLGLVAASCTLDRAAADEAKRVLPVTRVVDRHVPVTGVAGVLGLGTIRTD